MIVDQEAWSVKATLQSRSSRLRLANWEIMERRKLTGCCASIPVPTRNRNNFLKNSHHDRRCRIRHWSFADTLPTLLCQLPSQNSTTSNEVSPRPHPPLRRSFKRHSIGLSPMFHNSTSRSLSIPHSMRNLRLPRRQNPRRATH